MDYGKVAFVGGGNMIREVHKDRITWNDPPMKFEAGTPGIVQQIGDPRTMYNRPANVFVAGFIGSPSMNFLDGKLVADHTISGTNGSPTAAATIAPINQREILVIRQCLVCAPSWSESGPAVSPPRRSVPHRCDGR